MQIVLISMIIMWTNLVITISINNYYREKTRRLWYVQNVINAQLGIGMSQLLNNINKKEVE